MRGGLDPEDPLPATAPPPRSPARAAPEPTLDARVLAVLTAERRPWTAEEFAARLDVPVRNVKRALGKLVSERHAKRAGGGRFVLARHRPS